MVEARVPSERSSGWHARLDLEFIFREDETVLGTNRHVGPLRLQRPLYPEKGVCHAVILHPPGGVVGGDRLAIHASVQTGASALVTTPGAAKFYRTGGVSAVQENRLHVENGGTLEWLPQETIVYPGADVDISTRVDLEAGAGFVGWEILCLGLAACGRPFDTGSLTTRWDLYRQARPMLSDRLRVMGESDINRPTGLRGFPVTALFVAVGCGPGTSAALRERVEIAQNARLGITRMDDLLVARYLGHTSWEAKRLFQNLWTWLRPRLLGRQACPPRIWST